jgi:hypothetical protein
VPTPDEIVNVRREAIGYSTDTATLPDVDIEYYWTIGGAVLLTAALCCEMLAARAGGVDVLVTSLGDGVSFDKHVQPDELRARARVLRQRALLGEDAAAAAAGVGGSVIVEGVWAASPDAFSPVATDEFSA